MSAILDMVTGGGLLPHVYCKKITLETAGEPNKTNITLNLELYQSVKEISKSSWLNSLGDGSNQFLDSMFIQILQYKKAGAVEKLKPSYRSNTAQRDVNIYTAKEKIGDGFLPRRTPLAGEQSAVANEGIQTWGPGGFANPFRVDNLVDELLDPVFKAEPAIQISVSSLLGNLTKKDVLLQYAAEGKVRQEIIKGEAYYVIPFEYKCENFNEQGVHNNLGFVIYAFLDTPNWFKSLDADYEVPDEFFEEFVVEGPINSEVVYLDGKVQTSRESFFLPDGQAWDGSVHWHGPDNPAPDGYHGDGGLSGLDPASPYTGWMVGEKHQPGVDQPKLRLASVSNNKISDFRSSFQQSNLEEHGLDDEQNFNEDILIAQGVEQKFIGPGNTFLLPFQRERKKYLLKGTTVYKSGKKLVGSSNDAKYSKLYITRDTENNARGIFFINFRNLLENNSNLYPLLFDAPAQQQDSEIVEPLKQQIMSYGKLLKLSLYRDRVDRKVLNTRYEEFQNDTPYEDPSKLIGSISDLSVYQTPNQNNVLTEISLSYDTETNNNPFKERYFMFTDREVSEKTAGIYRYRVEMSFKDGTYEFLYEILKQCARMQVLLDDYYNLSVSGENINTGDFSFDANMVSEQYAKSTFVPYFQNNSYNQVFLARANEKFPNVVPWVDAPLLIKEVLEVFGAYADFDPSPLSSMLHPTTGSPRGISYFSSLLGTCIKKLENLLGTTSLNKTGSELNEDTVPDGYSLNSQFDFVVSPSEQTIYEDHTFDSPSELFEAVMNKDVYMDYLSIGMPMSADFTGLRKISPIFYKDRARLDAAKFSPLALSEASFTGQSNSFDYKGATIQTNITAKAFGTDYLHNTAYSYLTPSIVEYSDPSIQNNSFNFYYTAFSLYARSAIQQGTANESDIYSSDFLNWHNYEKLLVNLLNYNKNKQNYIDSDTTSPYLWYESFNAPEEAIKTREAYKRLIEETGLTLHDFDEYGSFFNKESGASKQKIGSIDIGEEYPLEFKDFSDTDLYLDSYFRSYVSTMTAGIPTPAIKAYSYKTSLPNSFKYYWIEQYRKNNNINSALNSSLSSAYNLYLNSNPDPASPSEYAPMLFFNANLTARIEVFRGTPTSKVPKDDEDSWSLLKFADIAAAQGRAQRRFLCRIVLYNESFSQQVKVPIVDKYFLLDLSAVHLLLTPPSEPQHEMPRDWEHDNFRRIEEFRTMTEKGIRDQQRRGPLRPPPMGPDPDPTSRRSRTPVADPRGPAANDTDAGRKAMHAKDAASGVDAGDYVEKTQSGPIPTQNTLGPKTTSGNITETPGQSMDGSY